jgi:chromate reductase
MHSITIISATNRVDSNTEKVANYYKSALKSKGVDVELFSLKDLPESVLHTDLYGKRPLKDFKKLLIHTLISNRNLFLLLLSIMEVLQVF